MIFLARTVFWFCVVLAFWPNNEENQKKTLEIIKKSAPSITESVAENTQRLAAFTLSSNALPAADYFSLRPAMFFDTEGNKPVPQPQKRPEL